MSPAHIIEILTGACMLCTPAVGFVISEATESPIVGGVAVLVATLLLVPVVRWMMTRQDALQKESSDAAVRREKREDERHEAFQSLVVTLGTISMELRALNDHHKEMDRARVVAVKEIIEKIDDLPERIMRNCNGD